MFLDIINLNTIITFVQQKKLTIMKKVFVFAALTLAVFSFSSCKKDYTCSCTSAINGTTVGTPTSMTINDTKSNAKTSCEDGSSSQTTGGITQTVTCTIQ
jgi:hypothetical protein